MHTADDGRTCVQPAANPRRVRPGSGSSTPASSRLASSQSRRPLSTAASTARFTRGWLMPTPHPPDPPTLTPNTMELSTSLNRSARTAAQMGTASGSRRMESTVRLTLAPSLAAASQHRQLPARSRSTITCTMRASSWHLALRMISCRRTAASTQLEWVRSGGARTNVCPVSLDFRGLPSDLGGQSAEEECQRRE